MTTKSTRPSWVVSLSGSKEGPFAGRYFGSVHFGGDPLWRATKHRTIGRADTMACIARTQSLQGHKVRWVNAQVFRFVVTHNLIPMAQALGIYEALWGCDRDTVAAALIEPLTRAVTTLATHQAQLEAFDAPNGWGKRESLLLFLARLLQACKDNPKAKVEGAP